jgi:RIO kinase 1
VFKHAYIPRTLDQVIDFERDVEAVENKDKIDVMYTKILGLRSDLTGADTVPDLLKAGGQDAGGVDSKPQVWVCVLKAEG